MWELTFVHIVEPKSVNSSHLLLFTYIGTASMIYKIYVLKMPVDKKTKFVDTENAI